MAVNMMDIVNKTGDRIHADKLSKSLGCAVVEISALKGTGINEAINKAVAAAKSKKVTQVSYNFADAVETVIESVEDKFGASIPQKQ